MANCDSIDPFLTPYVDGELPTADRDLVDRHLHACAPCHSRVAAERAVRDLLRARKTEWTADSPSAELRRRCAALTTASALSSRREGPRLANWRGPLAPLALALSFVILVGGAFLYQATDRWPRVMAAELTADHVKCFAINSVLGTHHARAAVESSMMSAFGWPLQLPTSLDREGFELVGARPCLYAEGRVAHLMYRYHGRPVSIFMLPRTSRPDDLVEVLGHEAAIWSTGDRTFVLVARESRSAVERMASFARAGFR
jgi:anti-sigma factor RsiW